ncbi:hypothetical protein F5B20DRAFT_576029 [Whalleya microplaca]|nr:hypothetical protein F5B20DRAFT_576029 [Whalleya microplaca]
MKDKEYTRIDRLNLLRTLEARLAAQPSNPLPGPQVQLFRVKPHRAAAAAAAAPPPVNMVEAKTPEPPSLPAPLHNDGSPQAGSKQPVKADVDANTITTKPPANGAEDRIMNPPSHPAPPDQQRARSPSATATELETARRVIADLRTSCAEQTKAREAAEAQCAALRAANQTLLKTVARLEPFARGGVANGVVRIHRVVWGSRTVSVDEGLTGRLLDVAARGEAFVVSEEFVGGCGGSGGRDEEGDRVEGEEEEEEEREKEGKGGEGNGKGEGEGTGYGGCGSRGQDGSEAEAESGRQRGKKTLVVAYSRPLSGPLRWLVVEEGCSARFEFL